MSHKEEHMPTPEAAQPASARKRYTTPALERYGDVRDLTLGPSPGRGESGTPKIYSPKKPRP